MENYEKHYLYPSNLFMSRKPHIVSTILGSCVSVCLYDPVLQVGGINHYMLPLWNGQELASPKYGNIAIIKLIEKMTSNGSQISNIKAKLFGGGEIIETKVNTFQIGERNISVAKEMLESEKIPIVSRSVGGKLGRKILYNTFTGEVGMRFIEKF
ncbi:MAG: chemotaxis protein CheD [Bacteroidetes bacterium GWE2_29_8]|nr:MAG: chemotaxis protein CheD [Bacteroidetes bacterium GWE2_29_8]OFY20077.1 MAG: chemotaxis protein CheD [Bacteroidetes bacterium GWF2_29_10]